MSLPEITLKTPAMLYLGLAAAAILIAGHMVRRTGAKSQLYSTTIARALVILMITLALANPAFVSQDDKTAVMFVVDRSKSIGKGIDPWLQIKSMASRLGPKDVAGVVEFGGESRLSVPPMDAAELRPFNVPVSGNSTDISRALRTGRLSFPEGYSKKIVLLSDGNETEGLAAAEARRLAADGIVLDTIPIGGASGNDVSVRSVAAPDRVRVNEPFKVRVTVDSTAETQGELTLLRNGAVISRRSIDIRKGGTAFFIDQDLAEGMPSVYEARIKCAEDAEKGNNAAQAIVDVQGKPKVLVLGELESEASALRKALEDQGFDTVYESPISAPQNMGSLNSYDGIILNNLSAIHFSDAYLDMLKSYVENLGGGLLAIGGPQSFGLGGYRNTPLEEVLPVSMDVREKVKFPSMAMAIVLDHSGSMGGEGQGATKLDLAKEATMSVVDLLPDDAQLGVLEFDTEYKWAVPLGTIRNKDAVADKLSAIDVGGGTRMYEPLTEAYKKLAASKAVIKHIIAITDGQSEKGPFDSITQKMAAAGMTVSTVAIGEDADRELLAHIASLGKGRYYYTNDIFAIPRIFVTEAFMASKVMLVEKRFVPKKVAIEPLLKGFESIPIPALSAHIVSVAKPESTVALETPEGDPLLVSWRIGLGRTAAFMSDSSGKWSGQWANWSETPRFWTQVTRWVTRSWRNSPLQAVANVQRGKASIAVDAIDSNGNYIDFLNLKATLTRAGGGTQTLPLTQSGPGRYLGETQLSEPGSYMAVITDGDASVEPQSIPLSLPYPEELKVRTVNLGLLRELSEITGGITTTTEGFQFRKGLEPSKDYHPLWPFLLIASLFMMVLDLLIRSIPEDQWVALTTVGSALVTLKSGLRAALMRQAQEPERYEEMIWKAKEGTAPTAAEKRYLGEEVSPTSAAGLYIARLKQGKERGSDNGKVSS